MLQTISLLLALFTNVIVQSDLDCMYVESPRWEQPNGWTGGKSAIIPIGFCEADNDESRYFMCTPWNEVYVVQFNNYTGCDTEPSYMAKVQSSNYNCDGGLCDIWHIKSNEASMDNCALADQYEEVLVVRDECFHEDGMSVIADCDTSTDPASITYTKYYSPGMHIYTEYILRFSFVHILRICAYRTNFK